MKSATTLVRHARRLVWLLTFAITFQAEARICTSTGNGNWDHSSTWDCVGVPTGGDTVIIQVGDTVTVDDNNVYNGLPLHIMVYGVWHFVDGGAKVSLPCGSYVEIFPPTGTLIPNSNSGGHSETVRICNVTWWYFDQGAQGGYQIWPGPPLPVELVDFSAEQVGERIHLEWSTASETGTERFEVYRGRGPEDRELAGTIPAAGTSLETLYYLLTDDPPMEGLWYYFLYEVDRDQSPVQIANVALVYDVQERDMTCVPNPVESGRLLVEGAPEHNDDLETRIGGIMGQAQDPARIVWDVEGILSVDVSMYGRGTYVLTAMAASGERRSCRFIVP